MTTAEPARPANYAFRRIVDAAEDRPSDNELEHTVLQEIAALDPAQREDLINMLAGTVSRLFARQRPRRSGRKDTQIVNRTVGAIVGAARSCSDLAAFHRAFQLHTDPLSRHQLARVAAALATELAACCQNERDDRPRKRIGRAVLEKWPAEPPK